MAIGSLLVILLVSEWWPIAVAHDEGAVAEYPFASEHAMADGGWNYANPELYAWTALLTAVFMTAGSALLSLAILRRSRALLAGFLVVLFSHWGISTVLSRRDWEHRRELRPNASSVP
jgi:hypothetical protein